LNAGFSRLTRPAASACFQRLRELSCDWNVLVDGLDGVYAVGLLMAVERASTMLLAIWITPADLVNIGPRLFYYRRHARGL
jgi:hypothetical protein